MSNQEKQLLDMLELQDQSNIQELLEELTQLADVLAM